MVLEDYNISQDNFYNIYYPVWEKLNFTPIIVGLIDAQSGEDIIDADYGVDVIDCTGAKINDNEEELTLVLTSTETFKNYVIMVQPKRINLNYVEFDLVLRDIPSGRYRTSLSYYNNVIGMSEMRLITVYPNKAVYNNVKDINIYEG